MARANKNRSRTIRTPERRAKILELAAAAELPTISEIAKAVGIGRTSLYDWLDADEEFDKKLRETLDRYQGDALEAVAVNHALKGVEKPVYQGGELVGHVTEWDHNLLRFLLVSRRPHRYAKPGDLGDQLIDLGEELKAARARVGGKAE